MDACRTGWCCLILTSFSLCGCITPDPSVDLLEGELRWMEDQLYMMEDQLQLRCDELVACRKSAKDGRKCDCDERNVPTPADSGRTRLTPAREPEQYREVPELIDSPSDPTPPLRQRATPPAKLPPKKDVQNDISTPRIDANDASGDFDTEFNLDDIPDELLGEPNIQLPEPDAKPASPNSIGTPPELDTSGSNSELKSIEPLFISADVEKLRLNAARVSSRDADVDQEQLLIVVEPQSENDQYIEMSAPIKVSLEDANDPNIEASLSSWNFNAVETGGMFRNSKMGRGIHLALDWPSNVPLVDDLRVVVAYRRLDGEEVHAEKILHPKVQATSVVGWVPAARSSRESNQTIFSAETPARQANDPFELAEHTEPNVARTIFQTVPIPSIANQNAVSAPASWTEPISRRGDKLTPVASAILEPIEEDVFANSSHTERLKENYPPQTDPSGNDDIDPTADPFWTPYR